jgi:hypothetical protein
MKAILIVGDEQPVASVPFKGTLHDARELLGVSGIELLQTPIPRLYLLVDEDARLKRKAPVNHKAMLFSTGPIFGPVLLSYVTDEVDFKLVGVPERFDFPTVAESSYQRICASLGEHPYVTLSGKE